MISKQYIAGFFDGEGSVGVYRSSGKFNSWHLRTQLSQNKTRNSTRIMSMLKKQYGGNVSVQISQSGRDKFNWQLNSWSAVKFLSDIEPYLILKKKQAKLAISWQKSRPAIIRNKKGQITRSRPQDIEYNMKVVREMKRLKL